MSYACPKPTCSSARISVEPFCTCQVCPPSVGVQDQRVDADRPAALRVGEVDAEERLLDRRCPACVHVAPPSAVVSTVPSSPTIQPRVAVDHRRRRRGSRPPSASGSPSAARRRVVTRIAPKSPTATPYCASTKSTLNRCWSVPLVCGSQVAPPSVVCRIRPERPTIQPCLRVDEVDVVELLGGLRRPAAARSCRRRWCGRWCRTRRPPSPAWRRRTWCRRGCPSAAGVGGVGAARRRRRRPRERRRPRRTSVRLPLWRTLDALELSRG